MNQRIVAINDQVHDQVQKLLPWFVVDSLKGEELALVNQHLNVCPVCQADFAWQCKLQAIQPAMPETGDTAPDVDRAFARLRERIDTTKNRATQRTTSPSPMQLSAQRLMHGLQNGRRSWMPWALVVQCATIAALVVVLVVTMQPADSPARYRTLSALSANKPVAGNVVVVFKPDTSEQNFRRILSQAGARIVDGPTVTDAYVLAVPDEKLTATVKKLRSDPSISLAESLKGNP